MKVEINRDGIIVKKSICVIEDEQDIRESVKEFFECNDYEVFDYSSAEDFYENKINTFKWLSYITNIINR